MKTKINNWIKPKSKENQELCEYGKQIQKILDKGYELKKWINSQNKDALFLCKKGDNPWKGVYIQTIEK